MTDVRRLPDPSGPGNPLKCRDHVLIGILLLTVATVASYRLVRAYRKIS